MNSLTYIVLPPALTGINRLLRYRRLLTNVLNSCVYPPAGRVVSGRGRGFAGRPRASDRPCDAARWSRCRPQRPRTTPRATRTRGTRKSAAAAEVCSPHWLDLVLFVASHTAAGVAVVCRFPTVSRFIYPAGFDHWYVKAGHVAINEATSTC